MTWKNNWAPKEPKNKTHDQDCGIMKSKTGVFSNKFAALQCSASAHPVCQFENRVRLELRGICKTDDLDTQYTVYNSTHLLGDSHNWIRNYRDDVSKEWQLVDRKKGTVLASMEKPALLAPQYSLFPLGTNKWFWKDGSGDNPPSCADCSPEMWECKSYRTMILHLVVQQPGYFCCNDGACINSDYR